MKYLKNLLANLSRIEQKWAVVALIVFCISSLGRGALAVYENSAFVPVQGGTYREGLVGQPIALNPILSPNQIDQDLSALLFEKLEKVFDHIEVAEDFKTYTLKLKEDLRWSNGQPFSSDDVIFTVRTIQDPETRSPLAKNWQGVIVERVSALQTKLILPTPFAFFKDNIENLRIIPKHIFSAIPPANLRLSAYNLEPVGNGAYQFEKLEKRKDGFITEIRLSRNPEYAGPEPFIEHFVFKFFGSQEELLDAFRLRDIDGFGSLTPIAKDVRISNAVTERIPMPRYYALFFNAVNNTLLDESKLREALTLALDTEAITKNIFGDQAAPLQGPVFLNLVQTNIANVSSAKQSSLFDPEKAEKILAELGTQDIVLNLTVPNVEFLRPVTEEIRKAWQAVGVKEVNIISLSPEELVGDVLKTRSYEILLFGNVFENPADLFPFWHSSQRFYPGLNLSLYQNTTVDRLIEEIRQGTQEQTPENLQSINRIITEDRPAVFLFSLPYFYAHREKLGGFRQALFTTPADRFANVTDWYVITARVLETQERIDNKIQER